MKLTYLLINVFTIAIPLAFSFHKKLQFHRTWIAFWPATLFTAAIFIIWDIIFTNLGIWGFNRDYLTGIQLLNLPLEEWLFFICIPYAIVFTYAALKKIVRVDYFQGQAKSLNWVLSLLLFATRINTHQPALYCRNILCHGIVFTMAYILSAGRLHEGILFKLPSHFSRSVSHR